MRIGLALSGGGFRATLYHLGVIRFLRDADLLPKVTHITSVSGGSILAAHLALHWDRYCGTPEEFDSAARDIENLVGLDVRNRIVRRYPVQLASMLWRRLTLRRGSRLQSRTGLLERYYQRYLFGDACLHQLPASPQLHILSTNVSEGGLCSFTREGLLIQHTDNEGHIEVKSHRAGLAKVATAVAASSAFPAFFPPLELRAEDIGATAGEFPSQFFTDGGVFDNLGVRMFHYLNTNVDGLCLGEDQVTSENVCDVILASDVGRGLSVYGPDKTPGFLSTALRSSDILMNRVWQLERQHFADAKNCVFLTVTDEVPPDRDPTAPHPEIQAQVSHLRTDMDRFNPVEISSLVRHGYCVARDGCRRDTSSSFGSLPTDPPWDPTRHLAHKTKSENMQSLGAHAENVSTTARVLQAGTRRRLWRPLFDLRDWATFLYVPVAILLLLILPGYAYRTYLHVQHNAALTRAVTEMREDFGKMLDLLDSGPVQSLAPEQITDVDELPPRLADEGLDIISDNRITDLRAWLDKSSQEKRQVYLCRHVLVRKVAEHTELPGLRLQTPWNSSDLKISCENALLNPEVVRVVNSEQKNSCDWAVKLDFSAIPVGETVRLVVSLMQTVPAGDSDFEEQEWWQFEIDANPEIATSWILLPAEVPHADFNVIKSKHESPNVVELVKPTHRTGMYDGAVINWSVVHPDPGYVYSTQWSH